MRIYKHQSISREEFMDPVKQQQILDDIGNITFDVNKRLFVLRAVLPLVWKPLVFVLISSVFLEKVPHVQSIIMAKIFAHNIQESDYTRVYILCGLWAALALAPIFNSYKFLERKGSVQLTEGFDTIRYGGAYSIVNSASEIAKIVCNALASVFEMWMLASKIGWAAVLPVIAMVVYSGVSHLTTAKIEHLKKLSEAKKQPSFRTRYYALIDNIRTVKFYGWERAFDDTAMWVDEPDFIPPMFWRVLRFSIDLVGSSTTEIAAALAVTAYMRSSPTLTYVDVTLVMSTSGNITQFVASCMYATQIFKTLKENTKHTERLLKDDESAYIMNAPASDKVSVDLFESQFQWDNDKFALKPTTLQVMSGEFAVVVGRIGSGKSSLLSAICGEMPMTGGKGCVYGRIGYVSQKPWIMNTTLRENVLCGLPFDEDFYWRVIEACALADDISLFPAKDLSEIGHKGINLSGGQKVRLALARAVYSRADIFILDDLLAAVDAYVERQLIDQVLIGNGMLAGKTRILVTHAEHIVPFADRIITLDDGHVASASHDPAKAALSPPRSPTLVGTDSDSSEVNTAPEHFTYKPDGNVDKFEWPYLWRYLKLSGPVALSVSLAIQAFSTYAVYRVENLRMDSMLDQNPETMAASIRKYVVINAFVGIMNLQLIKSRQWLRKVLWSDAVTRTTRKQVLDGITNMPLPLIESLPSQKLRELFYYCRYVTCCRLPFDLSEFVRVVFYAIKTMVQLSDRMPVLLFAVVPYVAARYYLKTSVNSARKAMDKIWRRPGSVSPDTKLDEYIAGRETLRITGSLPHLVDDLRVSFADEHIFRHFTRVSFDYVVFQVDSTCEAAMQVIVFAIQMCRSLDPASNIGLAEIDLTLSLSRKFLNELKWLVNADLNIYGLLPYLARYFIYTELPREAPDIIADSRPPPNWPAAGTIEFRDYGMRYRDDTNLVLQGLALRVRPQEKIGIVGRTGAGKSSLTHALLRLVEPAQGSIYIDGINISKIGLKDLRSAISIIPQDPSLFVGTIRENLDPMNEFTDDEVWSAIRKGQIEEMINTPTSSYDEEKDEDSGPWVAGVGLDKWVESGGKNFSVGQRQLISLCRALLWQRKILILDEATANVDLATDRAVQRIIRQEFAECTILTIAHRLNTVMDSDRILVMDQGKVAEFDSPANLLAQDSLFKSLVESMELNESWT
ncbi:hypothetical protein EC988_000704 [Linderina pennispora]|nr:hypothetical protein EC988_000704 [Linderina pennispora]